MNEITEKGLFISREVDKLLFMRRRGFRSFPFHEVFFMEMYLVLFECDAAEKGGFEFMKKIGTV